MSAVPIETFGYEQNPGRELHPGELRSPLSCEEGFFVETETYKSAGTIRGAEVPYTLEVPKLMSDPVPVIIVNGFMGKKFGYDGLRFWIAQQGRAAVSINPPRTHGALASYDPRNLFSPMKLPGQAIWGVIKDIRQNFDEIVLADQFDLVGHSMGTPVAIGMAKDKTSSIRNILALQGAGLEDGHNTIDFVPRIRNFVKDELVPFVKDKESFLSKGHLHAFKSEAHYILAHPARTALEGLAVSNCYVREDLRRLKEKHGIGATALLGTRDTLLPAELTIAHSWGVFDHGEVIDGGHLLPMKESRKVAENIADLLGRPIS